MKSSAMPVLRSRAETTLFLTVAMAATVGIALCFQYIGGYIPCKLCYEQRIPYYVGAPLMLIAFLAAMFRAPAMLVRLLLLIGGALMIWGLYMGVYHSGVEWGWWAAPADCTVAVAPPPAGGAGMLDAINKYTPPSCDKAPWRMFGLSFAGWNVLASIFLAIVAFRGALAKA